MRSVEICKNLLKPLTSEDGQKRLNHVKEAFPPMYKDMMDMKNKLNIIYNDLLRLQGFITILKAEKSLYEKRIEFKKQLLQDYSKEEAVLEKIKSQLSILLREDI